MGCRVGRVGGRQDRCGWGLMMQGLTLSSSGLMEPSWWAGSRCERHPHLSLILVPPDALNSQGTSSISVSQANCQFHSLTFCIALGTCLVTTMPCLPVAERCVSGPVRATSLAQSHFLSTGAPGDGFCYC